MRYKLMRFMYGRNGIDQYGRFLLILSCILLAISYIFSIAGLYVVNTVIWVLAVAALVWCYVRAFSKNLAKRRTENAAYLKHRANIKHFFADKKLRFSQRKDYKFFKCPSCKAVMRVPRGKGKLRISCRKCGVTFERKT